MDSASIKTQYKPTWQVPVSLFMERARRKHEGWSRPPLLFHPSCVRILEISPFAQKTGACYAATQACILALF